MSELGITNQRSRLSMVSAQILEITPHPRSGYGLCLEIYILFSPVTRSSAQFKNFDNIRKQVAFLSSLVPTRHMRRCELRDGSASDRSMPPCTNAHAMATQRHSRRWVSGTRCRPGVAASHAHRPNPTALKLYSDNLYQRCDRMRR